MKVYDVDKKEFYKGYTLKYLLFFRKRLDLIERELDAGKLEQALVLTMDKPYVDYPEFNFYRINILIRLGHLELAFDVASDEKFAEFEPIQKQKIGLEEELRTREEQQKQKEQKVQQPKIEESKINEEDPKAKEIKQLKKTLLTKLYVGVLTIEDIDHACLSGFDKILLTICYYDKYSHANGLKYVKSIIGSITDAQERKIINTLRSRLENKHNNFFDIGVYKKYICSVDFNYANTLQTKIQTQLELERKKEEDRKALESVAKYETPITVPKEKTIQDEAVETMETKTTENGVEAIEPKVTNNVIEIIPDTEENPTSPIINGQGTDEIRVTTAKKKKKKEKKKQKEDNDIKQDGFIVRIKDAFASEVEIMGGCIYVEANNTGTPAAMKAFDIFESIVEQDVNNREALERFERLVLKFSRDKSIGLSYNEDRFNKYLKKEQR